MKPIVAIVGRPNVGKSTLFNRLIGERRAIIEDQPGITRDRIYGDAQWAGRRFTVVDTGGLQSGPEGELEEAVVRQAELAIREADVVVFLVDVRQGVQPDDHEVAQRLRRARKPVILAVNKVENLKHEDAAGEFYELGLGDLVTISALHGTGTGDLLDRVVRLLPPPGAGEEAEEDPSLIKVAVVGRPNVGKSTLVNALAGEERVIVSEVAGTTRDPIDVLVERDGDRFLFIDTAGMRRRSKVEAPVERYSVLRSLRAIDRSDVVLLLVDAREGVTDQDQKIADYTREQGKGAIVVVNKWDLVEKTDRTMQEYTDSVRYQLRFMDYVEVAFLSALTRARLPKLLPQIRMVWENHGRRVPTGPLNECIREAVLLTPPPSEKGRQLKIYYATQPRTRPPGIVLFLNDRELMHFSYARYLENRVRAAFDFRGTPIRWYYRERESRLALRPPAAEEREGSKVQVKRRRAKQA
ncbi:ribosome biogenesis GTPase Der [Caldinitratiruptor microaerophilus]|uniref:GTPase Der n=1 Tax=Caldinitratiruptor microaerophilus TaxID=671077 RepID=A0AA35G7Y6_9FIRM|nr:ribosome biogenesis GTPase Der [Caldinitratiruptor microaerophilus]BDG60410.1 GTPase Der [Caldinitratiruptor microaerophilus]